jgi:hypothetical protein
VASKKYGKKKDQKRTNDDKNVNETKKSAVVKKKKRGKDGVVEGCASRTLKKKRGRGSVVGEKGDEGGVIKKSRKARKGDKVILCCLQVSVITIK